MRKRTIALLVKAAPLAAFVQLGIAQQGGEDDPPPVVVSNAYCDWNDDCRPRSNHYCVDSQGDGECDYTAIPWEPVD